MEEASEALGGCPAEICQDCGSGDVCHRSYLVIDGQTDGRLVLLCEDCHAERLFGPE
jgi:hypothetical protein